MPTWRARTNTPKGSSPTAHGGAASSARATPRWREMVRADGIDILVDLSGQTPRAPPARVRPPPGARSRSRGSATRTRQAWTAMDYRIADARCDPPGHDRAPAHRAPRAPAGDLHVVAASARRARSRALCPRAARGASPSDRSTAATRSATTAVAAVVAHTRSRCRDSRLLLFAVPPGRAEDAAARPASPRTALPAIVSSSVRA